LFIVLHVIIGPDRALARKALGRVLSAADPDGFDIDRIDASASSSDAMFAAVTAVPFFGSQRVIVLTGLLTQVAGKSARGSKTKPDSDASRLIGAIPQTTTLILFDPDLGELSATVRRLLPKDLDLSVNEAPRGNALLQLAAHLAAENDSRFEGGAARSLLDRLFPGYWTQAPQNCAFDKPPSMEQLESEVAKLALAAYPDPITGELIDDLVPQRGEDRIFPLLDAVVGGNQGGALTHVDGGQRAGEDPSRMLNQIYQQIELAVGALAPGRPGDPLQAGRALGVANAYRMTKITESAQRGRINPARQLTLALETDRRMKTGRLRNPDEALVDLVVRVTTPKENR
jgi:DNA polymerase III delta subunit